MTHRAKLYSLDTESDEISPAAGFLVLRQPPQGARAKMHRDSAMSKDVPNEALLSALSAPIMKPAEASNEASKPVGSRTKFHPLLRDLTLTMATEFSVLAAGLVLVSLFGRLLGPVALGEFLLLRRVAAWLLAGVLLGMGNALPRYIAICVKKPQGERNAYFLAGTSCLMGFTVCVGVALYVGRQYFATWLFGDAHLAGLILPLGLMLAGLAAQTAAFSYYRGILAMKRANAIQLFHFAIIPIGVVVLLYPAHSVALIVGVAGALTVVAAALFARPIFRELARNPLPKLRPYAAELLRYGVGRVPGDFGQAALFALGPLMATHYLPLTQVAYLLLGSNFLLVMGYTAGPLTVVLLSKFSMMLGQNRLAEVRESLEHLVRAVLDISVFVSLQLVVFADVLVRVWVGPRFLPGISIIRLLILAIPPYLFYMALRSSIDAVTVKPRNAGNVMAALVIYLALTAVTLKALPANFLLEGIAGALVVALSVLGMLTARTFRDLYNLSVPWGKCAPSLLAAALMGAASFAFRRIQPDAHESLLTFLWELLASGLFLVALGRLGSPWLGFVWEKAFPGRRLAWFAYKRRAA